MLFNSLPFVILLLFTALLYYRPVLRQFQVLILILSSAFFYSYAQPILLLLLLFSASTNAICSYAINYAENSSQRKAIAVFGVVFNLGILAVFKYSNLLFSGLVTESVGGLSEVLVALPLPIGISFYTFQGISLVVDVFTDNGRKGVMVEKKFSKHYANTVFFIMFFPQLIAGPIVKAHNFLPQIKQKFFSHIDLYFVFKALTMGYFLKSVIADNLKDQTFWISAPYFTDQSSVTLLTMVVGYSFQIFADFAGYSLIAIGVAAFFGYRLPINFNFPYISRSITEFWRRWHISLSSWLKEYLYIGLLGGNRINKTRTYINLITVMFLGGLWHGAALSYGVWGLWHGVGLALERLFDRSYKKSFTRYTLFAPVVDFFKIIWVFSFVTFGWLFFKLNDFNDVVAYLSAIRENGDLSHKKTVVFYIALYSFPIVLYHMAYLTKTYSTRGRQILERIEPYLYAVLFALVITNGGIPGEFVYFQF